MKWTLMNTGDEKHAFVIGWSEVICFWRPRYGMPVMYKNPLNDEFHYYIAGRAFGVLTWLSFACLAGIIAT